MRFSTQKSLGDLLRAHFQAEKRHGLALSPDILNYLAENVTSSIRQLEGVIKKLGAISLLEGGEMDIERVKNSVRDFISTRENDGKRMDEIILAVSKKYDISRDDILSSKRNMEIAMVSIPSTHKGE